MHFSDVYTNAVQTFENKGIKPAYTQFLNILAKHDLTLRSEFIIEDNHTVDHRELSIAYFDIGNPDDITKFQYRLQHSHINNFYIREAIEGMYMLDIPESFAYTSYYADIEYATADIMVEANDEKIREIDDITCSDNKITFCHQNKTLGTICIEDKSLVQRSDPNLVKRISTALKGLVTTSSQDDISSRLSKLTGLSRVVIGKNDLFSNNEGYPVLNSANDWVNHYKCELAKICNEKISRKVAQEVFLHAFEIKNWHALKATESSPSNCPVVVIKLSKDSAIDCNDIRVGKSDDQAKPVEYLYFNNNNEVYAYLEHFMRSQNNEYVLTINPNGTPNLTGDNTCFFSTKSTPYNFDEEWFYRLFKSPKILDQVKTMADKMQKNSGFTSSSGNVALDGNYIWDRDINGYRVVLMDNATNYGPTLAIQARKESMSLYGAELDVLSFRRNEMGDITLCRDRRDDRVNLKHLGDDGIRTLFKWINFPLDPDELEERPLTINIARILSE
tara:strand:+ start:370 stop:1878 length:1509 start_codon:yes stop_codon:yes gene_type:complete